MVRFARLFRVRPETMTLLLVQHMLQAWPNPASAGGCVLLVVLVLCADAMGAGLCLKQPLLVTHRPFAILWGPTTAVLCTAPGPYLQHA